MTAFLDLPVAQQTAIMADVRTNAALFKSEALLHPSFSDLEDICRWAVDAYAAVVHDRYEQGIEDGRWSMHDDISSLAKDVTK